MVNLNLYASRVFSEHPTALWPMDEEVGYLSFITENQRQMSSWNNTNGIYYPPTPTLVGIDIPFPNSEVSYFELDTSFNDLVYFTSISPESFDFSNLNQDADNFTIGAYFKAIDASYTKESFDTSIFSYEIGYRYFDDATSSYVEETKEFPLRVSNFWLFGSATFNIPKPSGLFSIVIKVKYAALFQSLNLAINGITLGQNCEEFVATSLGSRSAEIVNQYLDQNQYGELLETVPIDQFGLGGLNGYYISYNNALPVRPGIPLVFGERNSIKIDVGQNRPVTIFPGYGFLNSKNRYSSYTAEFWMRAKNLVSGYKKIFGPLRSNDGIYLDGQSIKLVIGSKEGSYFLPSPKSPMLIDWQLSENASSLMINGVSVISLTLDSKNLALPNSSQDYVGFFQNDSIEIDVDCFAIYPYLVSSTIAKRRFVYGQAVDLPEKSNSYFGGVASVFDGASAKYANNYSYPVRGKWEQGVLENLVVEQSKLTTPNYQLPQIVYNSTLNSDINEWYSLVYENQVSGGLSNYFDFQDYVKYLWFETLDILQEDVKAFYCIFKLSQYPDVEEVLLRIDNRLTREYFSIVSYSDKLIYRFFDGTTETEVFRDYVVDGRTLFIGIDFDNISNNFSDAVRGFFANKSQLSVYIGGHRDLLENSASFSGGIYRVGFSDSYNFAKISNLFPSITPVYQQEIILDAGGSYFGNDPLTWSSIADGGVVASFSNSVVESMLGHVATYTLFPKNFINRMELDIATDSYWEDFIPLSYFATYVKDQFGQEVYDLDFITFNIDNPIRDQAAEQYGVSKNIIKKFVTFQSASSETRNQYSYYQNTVSLNDDKLVVPGDEWLTTKYEVEDHSIIYIPSGVSYEDLVIVTHLEISNGGIINDPIMLSSVKYSSQSLSEQDYNAISTKFGTEVYPFVKFGQYFNYAAKNPIRIYPDSGTYLYLNSNSGLEIVNDDTYNALRGISIPINQSAANEYQVGTIQLFMNFDQVEFPAEPVQIFELESLNSHWKFYVERVPYSTTRGRIYGIDVKTGLVNRGLAFFVNGRISLDPVINVSDWNVIGIDFVKILEFSNFSGAWRITGTLKINYVTYYRYISQDNAYDTESNLPAIRSKMLLIDDRSRTVLTAKSVFEIYTGTNRISNPANETSLSIGGYKYSAITDASWTSFIFKPE